LCLIWERVNSNKSCNNRYSFIGKEVENVCRVLFKIGADCNGTRLKFLFWVTSWWRKNGQNLNVFPKLALLDVISSKSVKFVWLKRLFVQLSTKVSFLGINACSSCTLDPSVPWFQELLCFFRAKDERLDSVKLILWKNDASVVLKLNCGLLPCLIDLIL
jgi:hypothetical protein